MDYEKMSVTLLRQECKKYGIQASGKKKNEMVECLIKYHEDNKPVKEEMEEMKVNGNVKEEEASDKVVRNNISKESDNRGESEEEVSDKVVRNNMSKESDNRGESEEEKIRLRKIRFGSVDTEDTNSVYIERKKPNNKKSIPLVTKKEIKNDDESKSKAKPVFSEEEMKKIEERKKRFASNQ